MSESYNITTPVVDKIRVFSGIYHHYLDHYYLEHHHLAFPDYPTCPRYGRYMKRSLSQDGHRLLMASSKRHTAPRRYQFLMA